MSDFNIRATVDAGDALRQLGRVQDSVKRVGSQVDRASGSLRRHSKEYSRSAVATNKFAKGALQQAGYQVGDFAVQVANGTSSMQAFGQQGSQLLGIFGPIGAVLGAAVAIFSAVGVAVEKSGADMSEFAGVLGALQGPVAALGNAMKSLSTVFSGGLQTLLQNIDTLIILGGLLLVRFAALRIASAATAVTLTTKGVALQYVALQTALAGRALTTYERIMITARGATIALGASLRNVGKVMMRFLPTALLLLAGYLIERFLTLVSAVGSFGKALSMVGDVVKEFVNNAISFLQILAVKGGAKFYDLKADALIALRDILTSIQGTFLSDTINAFKGMVDAIIAAWGYLKQAIPNTIRIAFNQAIDIAQSALAGLVDGINSIVTLGGRYADNAFKAPDLTKFKSDVESTSTSLGQTISDAFKNATTGSDTFTSSLINGLDAAVVDAVNYSNTLKTMADNLEGSLSTDAWMALKDAIAAATKEIDLSGLSFKKLEGDATDALTDAEKRVKAVSDSLKNNFTDAFMSVFDHTKSAKDKFKDFASAVIKDLYRILIVQQTVNAALGALGFSQGPSGQITKFTNPFGGGKAIGGPVQANTPYVVGERGPEMFIPSRSGSIVPNDKLSGGGVVVNQTFQFSANGDDSVKQIIAGAMPQIAKATQNAIVDARRRGGSMKQAFG